MHKYSQIDTYKVQNFFKVQNKLKKIYKIVNKINFFLILNKLSIKIMILK